MRVMNECLDRAQRPRSLVCAHYRIIGSSNIQFSVYGDPSNRKSIVIGNEVMNHHQLTYNSAVMVHLSLFKLFS